MIDYEQLKRHLPQYLTEESQSALFAELDSFPDNIDSRMYSRSVPADYPETILQGDCVSDFIVVNLPDTTVQKARGVVISNTCDIDAENTRAIPLAASYCPILNLEKFRTCLLESKSQDYVETYIDAIRRQRITQIIYFPIGGLLEYEAFAPLDRICSCRNESISRDNLYERRLFSLSDYGFYLLLLKISIHFTRIRENVNRGLT